MQYSSQTGWRSVSRAIEWLCMEDRHSVKLSRLLAFDCAGIERLSVPQRNSCVSLGEPICIVFSNLVRVLTALSQARRGPTHPVTVMFYTPAGPAVQLLETMAIALDRRLVRLCRHLSKNMNCEAER